MPGRERARVARGLREADQQQRDRRDHDHREVLPDDVVVREHRRRKPARDVADERDAVGAQVEERRCEQPADDEHERARDRGHGEAQRRGSPRARRPRPGASPVDVAQRRASTTRAPARRCRRPPRCRSASAARRSTTSTAAPARKPVTTAFERNWAIQPSFNSGEQQEQHACQQRDRRHELRRLVACRARSRAPRRRRPRRARSSGRSRSAATCRTARR